MERHLSEWIFKMEKWDRTINWKLIWELDKLLEMTLQAMAASEDIINAEIESEQ